MKISTLQTSNHRLLEGILKKLPASDGADESLPETDRLIQDPQTHSVEGGRGSDVVDYASEEALTY